MKKTGNGSKKTGAADEQVKSTEDVSEAVKNAFQNMLALGVISNFERFVADLETIAKSLGRELSDPLFAPILNFILESIAGIGVIVAMNIDKGACVDFAELLRLSQELNAPISAENLKVIADKYNRSGKE